MIEAENFKSLTKSQKEQQEEKPVIFTEKLHVVLTVDGNKQNTLSFETEKIWNVFYIMMTRDLSFPFTNILKDLRWLNPTGCSPYSTQHAHTNSTVTYLCEISL